MARSVKSSGFPESHPRRGRQPRSKAMPVRLGSKSSKGEVRMEPPERMMSATEPGCLRLTKRCGCSPTVAFPMRRWREEPSQGWKPESPRARMSRRLFQSQMERSSSEEGTAMAMPPVKKRTGVLFWERLYSALKSLALRSWWA